MNRMLMSSVPMLLGALGMVALTNSAQAVDPAHVSAGPVNFTPTLDVRGQYTDNFFRSTDDEFSTWALITTGRIGAWVQNQMNRYEISYQFKDQIYASSHDDDFTDQQVNLDINHEFNARNLLEIEGEYWMGHEQRGTGLTEGDLAQLAPEPVELDRTLLRGDYTYGSRDSRGRLRLGAEARSHEYQNFRDFTRYRDYDRDTLDGTFYWQVAPRTDLLAEVRYSETEYDETRENDPFGTLDSETWSYLVGAQWAATGKTSGSVRVGMYDREYDSSARDSQDGFHWEADVTWRPKSYSEWNFLTRRRFRETNGLGDAIDTDEYQVSWNHDWTTRSRTDIELLLAYDEYTGARREDDRLRFKAAYYYAFRRWLDFGAGYRYEERESNNRDDLDFDANSYYIEAKMSL